MVVSAREVDATHGLTHGFPAMMKKSRTESHVHGLHFVEGGRIDRSVNFRGLHTCRCPDVFACLFPQHKVVGLLNSWAHAVRRHCWIPPFGTLGETAVVVITDPLLDTS